MCSCFLHTLKRGSLYKKEVFMAMLKKVVMACMVLQVAMVIQAADMNHNKQGNLEILQSLTPFEPKSDMEVSMIGFSKKVGAFLEGIAGKYDHVHNEIVENVYDSTLRKPVYNVGNAFKADQKMTYKILKGDFKDVPKRTNKGYLIAQGFVVEGLFPRMILFYGWEFSSF